MGALMIICRPYINLEQYPELQAFVCAESYAEREATVPFLKASYDVIAQVDHDTKMDTNDSDLLQCSSAPPGIIAVFGLLDHLDTLIRHNHDLSQNNNEALQYAAASGNLTIANRLLNYSAVWMNIDADNNAALKYAAANGHLPMVNLLLKYPAVWFNIAADNNAALRYAAGNGNLPVVNCLIKHPVVWYYLTANHNAALIWSAERGYLPIVNRLLEFSDVVSNITARDNLVLIIAALNGHYSVVNRILQFESVRNTITTDNNAALRYSASNGYHSIVVKLLSYSAVKNKVTANNNEALRESAKNRHLSVVTELLKCESVQNMITENNNEAFRESAKNGHLSVVNKLLEYEEVVKQSAINKNEALIHAITNRHVELIHRLFEIIPVFISAEQDQKFQCHIQSFISKKLQFVHELYVKSTHNIFDISQNESKLYFYIIRHLIRQNSLTSNNEIGFLLAIPNIHLLVSNTVTENEPNELVRLAIIMKNQEATNLLMQVPSINALYEQNKQRIEFLTHLNEIILQRLNNQFLMQKTIDVYRKLLQDIQKMVTPDQLAIKIDLSITDQLERLANLDSEFAYFLAQAYEGGTDGFSQDRLKSYHYYALAARQNHTEAKKQLEQLASSNPDAQYVLGRHYYAEKDLILEAAHWCVYAEIQEHKLALKYLTETNFSGLICLDIAGQYERDQSNPARSAKRALEFISKAANKLKDKEVMLQLAQRYQLDQISTKKDLNLAFEYYIKAAKLGDLEALIPLERLVEGMDAQKQLALSRLYGTFFHNIPKKTYWRTKGMEGAELKLSI